MLGAQQVPRPFCHTGLSSTLSTAVWLEAQLVSGAQGWSFSSPQESQTSHLTSVPGDGGDPHPLDQGAYLRWPVKELTGRQISLVLPGMGESLAKKVFYLKTKAGGGVTLDANTGGLGSTKGRRQMPLYRPPSSLQGADDPRHAAEVG